MISLARSGGAVFAAAVLAVVAAAPRPARADEAQLSLAPEPAPAPTQSSMPPITIRVAIASASEAEGEVDPKAQDIYEHLPARFHSIQLLEERTVKVYFGDRESIPLSTGSTVSLLPVAVHHGQLHLQLEIPDVLNTSMRMSNRRAFYVGGVTSEKGTLIFKLVPEFGQYTDTPATVPSASPRTVPAGGSR